MRFDVRQGKPGDPINCSDAVALLHGAVDRQQFNERTQMILDSHDKAPRWLAREIEIAMRWKQLQFVLQDFGFAAEQPSKLVNGEIGVDLWERDDQGVALSIVKLRKRVDGTSYYAIETLHGQSRFRYAST